MRGSIGRLVGSARHSDPGLCLSECRINLRSVHELPLSSIISVSWISGYWSMRAVRAPLRLLCWAACITSAACFGSVTAPASARRDVRPRTIASPRSVVTPPSPSELSAASSSLPPPLPPLSKFPCGDALDRRIGSLALPAMLNFLILPITQSVDLFFIGKLQSALAIAGQAAVNQIFSSAAWCVSVIPVVTTPRVAKARAAGDERAVQAAVGEAIFIAALVSTLVAIGIGLREHAVLLAAGSATVLPFSVPYFRWRLPGLLAESISTVCPNRAQTAPPRPAPPRPALPSCVRLLASASSSASSSPSH